MSKATKLIETAISEGRIEQVPIDAFRGPLRKELLHFRRRILKLGLDHSRGRLYVKFKYGHEDVMEFDPDDQLNVQLFNVPYPYDMIIDL